MTPGSRRARVNVLTGFVAALWVSSCAHAVVTEPLADGTIRLRCDTALPACLQEGAQNACHGAHYIVLRAVDELNVRGVTGTTVEARSSGALIQCGQDLGWGALGKPLEELEKATAAPTAVALPTIVSPPVVSQACVPGTTHLCVGPAACQGGQVCLPSAAAFGPCDCGPAPAPEPAPVHP